MTNTNEESSSKVKPVTPAEHAKIRDALSTKFGAHLRPGETLSVDLERDGDHCWGKVLIDTADDTFRLELEAAVVRSDASDPKKWDPADRFEKVLDLLDLQLSTFFEEDRTPRFHDDWRIYQLEEGGVDLRFRGVQRHPGLDDLADQWLESGGDPGGDR